MSMVDSGKILEQSFRYAKEGLEGKWDTWLLLIISCIIFPLFLGYMLRIYRGTDTSPQLDSWGGMFSDGIKLLLVALCYALPVLILEVVLFASPGLVKTSIGGSKCNIGPDNCRSYWLDCSCFRCGPCLVNYHNSRCTFRPYQ